MTGPAGGMAQHTDPAGVILGVVRIEGCDRFTAGSDLSGEAGRHTGVTYKHC